MTYEQEKAAERRAGTLIVIGVIAIVVLCFVALPPYHVWQQHMKGKAELAKAEYSRQIAVVEAEAKMKSAQMLAQADMERAKGIAGANEIIHQSITPEYLRWYYIDGLHQQQDKTIIYVPTEAMVPITEAVRLSTQR